MVDIYSTLVMDIILVLFINISYLGIDLDLKLSVAQLSVDRLDLAHQVILDN